MDDFKVNLIDVKGKSSGKNPLFDILYPNIFTCSKKNSGKTMLIYNILRKVVGKKTDLYIFCSTANKDATWRQIIDEFENKGNNVVVYDSIIDSKMVGKVKRKINNLENLVKSFTTTKTKKKKSKKKKQEGGEEKKIRFSRPYESLKKEMLGENHIVNRMFSKSLIPNEDNFMDGEGETPKKPERPNKKGVLYPEKIIIFDDLSEQIKDVFLSALLKKNRHFKSMVIVSSQFPNDLPPSSRSQFDYVFTWAGHNAKKQNVLRRMCDTNITEDEFSKLYHYATKEKYNFLLCDCRNNQFRKNFNELIYK